MIDATRDDPVAAVDALVGAIGPRLSSPAIRRLEVVLVTGSWLAGVSSVVTALRELLPEHSFVESDGLEPGDAPRAVVFVVSAAAMLTESECALLDVAAADTDVVLGVVSKIDVHRKWRDVLAADREMLATRMPRYREVPWVGVAALPDRGQPLVDDLVSALRERLSDPDISRRNRLRAWESRLQTLARRYERDAAGAGRGVRVETLREQRSTMLRQRRLSKSERTIALRSNVQQARTQLAYFARSRCATVRGELQEHTTKVTRQQLPDFETYARARIEEVFAEVDERTTAHLTEVAQVVNLAVDMPAPGELPGIDIPGPPLKSRRLETRLMMLLGAGFGLGIALTLSRLLANLAPGLTAAGIVACVAIGLAVTVWVVGTRGLLHDRAVLDRWVAEATASLRTVVEQQVATRGLAAESVLSVALGERNEAENAQVTDQVSAIDRELREHGIAAARAAALRDREMPTLRAALVTVQTELAELGEPDTDGEVNQTGSDCPAPPRAAERPASSPGESAPQVDADNQIDAIRIDEHDR